MRREITCINSSAYAALQLRPLWRTLICLHSDLVHAWSKQARQLIFCFRMKGIVCVWVQQSYILLLSGCTPCCCCHLRDKYMQVESEGVLACRQSWSQQATEIPPLARPPETQSTATRGAAPSSARRSRPVRRSQIFAVPGPALHTSVPAPMPPAPASSTQRAVTESHCMHGVWKRNKSWRK